MTPFFLRLLDGGHDRNIEALCHFHDKPAMINNARTFLSLQFFQEGLLEVDEQNNAVICIQQSSGRALLTAHLLTPNDACTSAVTLFDSRPTDPPSTPVCPHRQRLKLSDGYGAFRAAMTAISTWYLGSASLASTVARVGAAPGATHLSQTEFISAKLPISASQMLAEMM